MRRFQGVGFLLRLPFSPALQHLLPHLAKHLNRSTFRIIRPPYLARYVLNQIQYLLHPGLQLRMTFQSITDRFSLASLHVTDLFHFLCLPENYQVTELTQIPCQCLAEKIGLLRQD